MKGLSIAGLVLGILSAVLSLVGLILSACGLKNCD